MVALASALGAELAEYPDAETVWNEFADLAPNWSGIRYDRLEERASSGRAPTATIPGRRTSTRPHPARPNGKGKFFPVEYQPPIELPDSEYPLVLSTGRTLYHYNSARMTMREDGVHRQAEGAVLRDLARGRGAAGPARRRPGPARFAPRVARGAGARRRPRLPRPRLDGAPLRPGEGELAHARRRRLADRDAGVQGLAPCASSPLQLND